MWEKEQLEKIKDGVIDDVKIDKVEFYRRQSDYYKLISASDMVEKVGFGGVIIPHINDFKHIDKKYIVSKYRLIGGPAKNKNNGEYEIYMFKTVKYYNPIKDEVMTAYEREYNFDDYKYDWMDSENIKKDAWNRTFKEEQ